jgi:NAD+ diphosphatase
VFAGNPLDRGERERRDEGWLTAQEKDPDSRFLPLWRLNVPISDSAEPTLGWVHTEVLSGMRVKAAPYFLGLLDGVAHFAIDVSELEDPDRELGVDGALKFEEARTAATLLAPAEAGILAQARSQVDWHMRHRFCGVCGALSRQERGGQMRRCPDCDAQHFPRTDPVVIVVVSSGDRCILGQSRGRLSEMKMYSALAGFVDQGESIEEAVRREVMEEAGVEVGDVRYHSSQPWPFPSSLMIGCHAGALSTKIRHDDVEMADVRWFDRRDVLRALAGENEELNVPGEIAIAHHLIKAWATGEVQEV